MVATAVVASVMAAVVSVCQISSQKLFLFSTPVCDILFTVDCNLLHLVLHSKAINMDSMTRNIF